MKQLVLVGGMAALAFLLFMKKDPIIAQIDEDSNAMRASNPELDSNLANAQAASKVADIQLAIAQEAEKTVGLDEQTAKVIDAEKESEYAQSVAVSNTNEENLEAARKAEQKAEEERAKLIKTWNESLNIAISSMNKAITARNVAVDAYNAALRKVEAKKKGIAAVKNMTAPVVFLYEHADYRGDVSRFPLGEYSNLSDYDIGRNKASSLKVAKYFSATLFDGQDFGGRYERFDATQEILAIPTLSRTYVGNDEVSSIKVTPCTSHLEKLLRTAEITAGDVRTEVVSANSAVNDTVERVLTITADIRVLNILGARISKVETFCSALLTKLASVETKVNKLSLPAELSSSELPVSTPITTPAAETPISAGVTITTGVAITTGELYSVPTEYRQRYTELRNTGWLHTPALTIAKNEYEAAH